MLPSRPVAETQNRFAGGVQVQPGSWWRLADETHEMAGPPAAEGGLVLLVKEARIVDGELHTIVLHPHPAWHGLNRRPSCKLLAEDFLTAFRPEPEGDSVRDAEIAAVMSRVAEINASLATPPEPMALLERQTGRSGRAPKDASTGATPGEGGTMSRATSLVPKDLLPSEDVVSAQAEIETRIRAFEAQRVWIEDRAQEIRSEMALVSLYHEEKGQVALARISTETAKSKSILERVQTMRLFLGEDMAVTELRTGESAPAEAPLTFLQRMLYLDEEIFVHEVLDGFDGDMIGDLAGILQADMGLVERMLPYERSVVICRPRRTARETRIPEGSSIQQVISGIFDHMAMVEADKRVQVLVRDGGRVHMITADEATSNAERLFPSRAEIDALFKQRGFGETKSITPDDVDYSDARARHDTRALFYKRFLLILWGVHERSDVFGPFMEKGANWLDATTHSDRFRFVHDEENVLEDGRPSLKAFIAEKNGAMRPGSRVMGHWSRVADEETAPAICVPDARGNRTEMKAAFVEEVSPALVTGNGSRLEAKVPVVKGWSEYDRRGKSPVNTTIALRRPERAVRAAHMLHATRVTDGVLVLDELTLSDLDHYIASRTARRDYADYLPQFNAARKLVRDEEKRAAEILEAAHPGADATTSALHARALKLWRAGNKWGWPETERHLKAVGKLVEAFTAGTEIDRLAARHERVLEVVLRANGQVAILCDTERAKMADGTPLPWLREVLYAGPQSKTAKSERVVSWFDKPAAGRDRLRRIEAIDAEIRARLTEPGEIRVGFPERKSVAVEDWRTPRFLTRADAAEVIERLGEEDAGVAEMTAILEGDGAPVIERLLEETVRNYRTDRSRSVELPDIILHLGLLTGPDRFGVPAAWRVSVGTEAIDLALHAGLEDRAFACADRIYADPRAVIGRRREWAGRKGCPIRVSTRRLGSATTPASLFAPGLCLSFDEALHPLELSGLPEGAPAEWRCFFAPLVAEPSRKGHARHWPSGTLAEGAARLSFAGKPGAEELLDRLLFPPDAS